jgi:hypothetical protein
MLSTSDFQYLSYLILFVLAIYFLILTIFFFLRRKEIKKALKDRPPAFLANHHVAYDDSSFTFDWTTRIEDVGDSFWNKHLIKGRKRKTFYRYALFILRLFGLGYYFIYGVIITGSAEHNIFRYFDGWNLILCVLYFGFSSYSSYLLIHHSAQHPATALDADDENASVAASITTINNDWSYSSRLCAVCAHMLYEIVGSNTIMLLFGELLNINTGLSSNMKSITQITIAFLIIESLLNNIKIRFDQYPATAAWLMCYFLVIWPAVFTGSLSSWPYSLLQTSSTLCFGNYTILFITSFFSFVFWYFYYKFKRYSLLYCIYGKSAILRATEEDAADQNYELQDLQSDAGSSSVGSARQSRRGSNGSGRGSSQGRGPAAAGDNASQQSGSIAGGDSFYSNNGDAVPPPPRSGNSGNGSSSSSQQQHFTQMYRPVNQNPLARPHSNVSINSQNNNSQNFIQDEEDNQSNASSYYSQQQPYYNGYAPQHQQPPQGYGQQPPYPYNGQSMNSMNSTGSFGRQLMQNVYDPDTLNQINLHRRSSSQSVGSNGSTSGYNLPRPPAYGAARRSSQQFNDLDNDILQYGGLGQLEDP